ncbi:MAG: aldose epimerase family protein [Pseudomonadota bacterium]
MNTNFGETPEGERVELVHLTNGGLRAQVMTWGATLQDFRLEGHPHSLILGAPDLAPYLGQMRYVGAIVGPVANRIAGGTAELDGRRYHFDRNEAGRTTLHGGAQGIDNRVWQIEAQDAVSCQMVLHLKDGEGGFPGNRKLSALYALSGDGVLTLTLSATTDAPTWINLANHAYWTLTGRDGLDDHDMTIAADHYLEVDDQQIPKGAPTPVDGTPFDFRLQRPVRTAGAEKIDHNFCLTGAAPALTLSGGGVTLTIETDAPGVQIFDCTGKRQGSGHDGRDYGPNAGLAIEPQYWPDSPNQSAFPSIRVDPGETWSQTSRYHFGTP